LIEFYKNLHYGLKKISDWTEDFCLVNGRKASPHTNIVVTIDRQTEGYGLVVDCVYVLRIGLGLTACHITDWRKTVSEHFKALVVHI